MQNLSTENHKQITTLSNANAFSRRICLATTGSETTTKAFGPKASLYTAPCCQIRQIFKKHNENKDSGKLEGMHLYTCITIKGGEINGRMKV